MTSGAALPHAAVNVSGLRSLSAVAPKRFAKSSALSNDLLKTSSCADSSADKRMVVHNMMISLSFDLLDCFDLASVTDIQSHDQDMLRRVCVCVP